jgi:hypothetical protein
MNAISKVSFKAVNAIKAEYSALYNLEGEAVDRKAVQQFQIKGVNALNKLVDEFSPDNLIDEDLIALVIGSLTDLQVRDYAMGITTAENLNNLNNLWAFLTATAPAGSIAPLATLWAITDYELGNSALALEGLKVAQADEADYPLAKLILRVITAGWPKESFTSMRAELHHKVVAGIFNEVK